MTALRPVAAVRNPLDLPGIDASHIVHVRPPAHESVCIMARRGLRPQRATATLVWPGHSSAWLFGLAMAVSAGPRINFFLRVLFARIPDPRPHRPARHPSR